MSFSYSALSIEIIHKTKGVVIGSIGLYFPLETVRTALVRSPDYESGGLISWGNMSKFEVNKLILRLDEELDREYEYDRIEQLERTFGANNLVWSLCFQRGNCGE